MTAEKAEHAEHGAIGPPGLAVLTTLELMTLPSEVNPAFTQAGHPCRRPSVT